MPKNRLEALLRAAAATTPAANDALLEGLAPIADAHAELLVLGSMPGAESLRLQQYYAHPRNHFWPIAGELFGAGPALGYAQRTAALRARGVAVWDVLGACRRRGSLDSAIDPASIRVNDFGEFLAAHPRLRRVAFNGAYAEATFHTRVRLAGVELPPELAFVRLPSTSPANASVPFAEKLAAWRAGLGGGPARR